MSSIHLYMNNPTAGAVDGTEISSGTNVLPLTLTLNASNAESAVAVCAVRCDEGYAISGDTTIHFVGTNTDKWQAAPDENYSDSDSALAMGDWQSTITLNDVADTNVLFWVKATSTGEERPQNDSDVKIFAAGITVVKGE